MVPVDIFQEYSFEDAVRMADNVVKIAKTGYNKIKDGVDGFADSMTKLGDKDVEDIFSDLIDIVMSLPSKVP